MPRRTLPSEDSAYTEFRQMGKMSRCDMRASHRVRTGDLLLTMEALCQLS